MDNLVKIIGTKIKSMELLFLLNNLKPVVRHGYYDEELPKVEKFCKQNNLFLVKSPFKVKPVEHGYSNKGIMSEDGMSFVYISKDELMANKALLFEIKQDHFNLGLILGYPECCCRFFEKHFPERSKVDNNYEIPILENSTGNNFNFVNNIFMRHRDYCLLSHFPCSLDCEHSIKIGERHLQLLKENYPDYADNISSNLKKEVDIKTRRLFFHNYKTTTLIYFFSSIFY